ncbi:MAG: hypothetical protein M3P06_14570 [Acidobacteriota bacterium]|nr:hypothetical protein [Acidobacteriota bacterium]
MRAILLAVVLALAASRPALEPLSIEAGASGLVRVSAGGVDLFTIQLTAPRRTTDETIRDEMFLLGDMVVVIRGAHYPRVGQCVNPGGQQLEVFMRDGRQMVSRNRTHVAAAHGNRFAGASRDWGVILEEESGSVYGYLFLKALREPTHVTLPELEWRGLGEQRLDPSGELVLPNMFLKGRRVSLVISDDGSHRIE